MRAWLAMLPAVGVLLSGCARQERMAPAGPGPRSSLASIVSADPSPSGDALILGVVRTGPALTAEREPRPPDTQWLVDLRTGAIRDLTPTSEKRPVVLRGAAGSTFSWRPDGGALAVGTRDGHIAVRDPAGERERVVSPEGLRCRAPVWSPDGKRLAFAVSAVPGPGGPLRSSHDIALYTMPADGTASPQLQIAGLAPSARWWWRADGRRLCHTAGDGGAARPAGPQSIAEPVSSDEVTHAYRIAWSPDHTKLAYSRADSRGRGGLTTVTDASFTPLMQWQDPDVPARGLWWSLDGEQVITRNVSGGTYLLDVARKTGQRVDDPIAADKEPAGWIKWNGKPQLLFIDEQWKRLVVMESPKGPAYTLVTLGKDGSPSLVLPSTKGN